MTLLNAAESRLRDEYVNGRIEVDEFEQRLDAILHDNPLPPDLAPLTLAATDAPGAIVYYTPIKGQRPPEWDRTPQSAVSQWYADAKREIERKAAFQQQLADLNRSLDH